MTLETELQLKDGGRFPVEIGSSYFEFDGREFALSLVRDISEHRATERARENAMHEALRLADLRSAFVAQMSHELRTPLNGILGYAQVLLEEKALKRPRGDRHAATLRGTRQRYRHPPYSAGVDLHPL